MKDEVKISGFKQVYQFFMTAKVRKCAFYVSFGDAAEAAGTAESDDLSLGTLSPEDIQKIEAIIRLKEADNNDPSLEEIFQEVDRGGQ